jgi:hypothetical protein
MKIEIFSSGSLQRGNFQIPKSITVIVARNHPEAIILASDVSGCIGYTGSWTGEIGDGGDLEHIDLSHMEKHVLQPNHSYIGNVGFIHESVPIDFDCQRTLVRLNVKNWEPKFQ